MGSTFARRVATLPCVPLVTEISRNRLGLSLFVSPEYNGSGSGAQPENTQKGDLSNQSRGIFSSTDFLQGQDKVLDLKRRAGRRFRRGGAVQVFGVIKEHTDVTVLLRATETKDKQMLKRFFDIFFSALGLILLTPLLACDSD